MSDRTTLSRLAKLVAVDVASGRPGSHSQAASQFLKTMPEFVLDLVDLIVAETAKKRSNENLITAYGYMIGQALEFSRFAIEEGETKATELVAAVRQRLLALDKNRRIEPALLLMLSREFSDAKLDPGPEIRGLMERLMEETAETASNSNGGGRFDTHLDSLARQVGGDPFDFHLEIQGTANAFAEDHRAAMASSLLQSRHAVAREAALGWLLDASSSVRAVTASAIGEAAAVGHVSGIMSRRLITLRNWLPEADRTFLDQAIKACRQNGMDIEPWPQSQVREVLVSGIDGAGVQSIFVLTQEGRRTAIGCILLKHGIGIRDAWGRHGLTRAEVTDFLAHMQEIDLWPSSLDYVRTAVAHGLAVNLSSGIMPPFATLDVIETAGLHGVQPGILSTAEVLRLLETEVDPVSLRPEILADLLASSQVLASELSVLDSWFEADEEVEQLLGTTKLSRAKRITLVQDKLLPRRAQKWAERLAWTALTLLHSEEDAPWMQFFASAKQLDAGYPIAGIPLMELIAVQTVEAYAAKQRSDRR